MKNRITVEHNNKVYEAISHQPLDCEGCLNCDLAYECFVNDDCLCAELVDYNYYFKEIEHVQNNIQSRSADHER